MIAGHAGDHEGELVVALQLAHGAAEEGSGSRAELVAGDDPAEHQRPAAVAERLVAEPERRRHRGEPVEPVENGKDRQAGGREAGIGKIHQRQAANAVIDAEQLARVEAVGQPAGKGGADQVEHAHHGEQPGGLHLGNAHVAAKRDQMRADKAVGGEAADEEGGEQQPEDARRGGLLQRRKRRREEIALGGSDRLRPVGAVAEQADRGRPLRHQEIDQRQQCRGRHRNGDRHRLPAAVLGKHRQQRQEHQQPGGGTCRHQAHHHAAIGLEPAVDDGRAEHGGDRARADAGEHAPGGDQVPGVGHQQAERRRARHQEQGGDQRLAHADALHQRRRERSGKAVDEDADRRGERDHVAPPAECVLQRQHHHRERRAQPGRDQQGEKDHADHHESVALAKRPDLGYCHVTHRYVSKVTACTYR